MQIATVQKIQNRIDASLKVLRFVWRHAFVLAVFGMMVAAILIGRISWENCFYYYVGAALLDWFKMKLKASYCCNSSREQMFQSARRSMDSNHYGSFAWAANPMKTGSPAWDMDPFAPGSSAYYSRRNSFNSH